MKEKETAVCLKSFKKRGKCICCFLVSRKCREGEGRYREGEVSAEMEKERLDYLNGYLHEENRKNKDRWRTIEDGISVELFTNSEAMEIISETLLSKTDREIATDKFVKGMTNEEISADVGYDGRTIQRKLREISKKLKRTFVKMCIARNIKPKI